MENIKTIAAGFAYWTAWAVLAALAGSVLAGLSACDQKPSAETASREIDVPVVSAGKQMENAASAAKLEVVQDQHAVAKKAVEFGKYVEDGALRARVKAALSAEPALTALAIDVSAESGIVTLNGTADSQVNRLRAMRVAFYVDGVRTVYNDLVVVRGS